ncbi:possible 2-component sensor protein [Flavobacteriaceae bacterium 3519-10]|nr:possible 2-component sensor protein [Flavobacteriaceae bacterium 3519-10]
MRCGRHMLRGINNGQPAITAPHFAGKSFIFAAETATSMEFFHVPILICFLLLAALAAVIWELVKSRRQRSALTKEVCTLKKKLGAVKLDYIETKLNPHLFKNILNSVQSHAYQTYTALDKLSGVLDYVLYESSERFVTPQQEFEFTKNLIDINRIKVNPLFDFRVKFHIDENDAVFHEKVLAPMVTADFIENAFKHTDFLADDSFILVRLSLEKGVLELKVQNKVSAKAPMEKDHSGFGTASLEQRLKIVYRKNFAVRKDEQGGIFTAHLKIDLNERYNQVHYTRR